MALEDRDPAYLWDMLEAARSVQEFSSGLTLDQYMQSRLVQLAAERALEIIGEAARRISDGFKQSHPEVPWQQIIAQRNVIAHEYDAINYLYIWQVVAVRIPELVALLEPLIPPLPSEDD
jgi:uncharacterized protein with HEPN domain